MDLLRARRFLRLRSGAARSSRWGSGLPLPLLCERSKATRSQSMTLAGARAVDLASCTGKIKKPATKRTRLDKALERMRSSRNLRFALANAADSLAMLLEPETLLRSTDPEIQLEHNFATVAECPPTFGLEVSGTIPECMNGVYVRNSSNPQFEPAGGYHIFDGDGMLHAVRIKDGVPSYCCRFTRTNRYLQEKSVGHALYPKVMGELTGWQGLMRLGVYSFRTFLGVVEHAEGLGTANAGLVFYNGRLLAISEDDLPYAVAISAEDGDLCTLGRYDISGSKLYASMTAHPKIDPITGEMFSYSYNVINRPYLQYWHTSAGGAIQAPVSINLRDPVLLHDFAITEKYVIIPDHVMVFRLSEMMAGRSPVLMDESKAPRFGILPKYAADDSAIRWFETPRGAFDCFHYLNGWEEGDEVVLVGSTMSPLSSTFSDQSSIRCYVTEFRMNLRSGKTLLRRVSELNLDVGRINEQFTGRKNRYAYLAMAGPWPKFSGIVKLDLDAASVGVPAEVGMRTFQPGCYGSEPFFVARTRHIDDEEELAEDDGYVVTYLHDENSNVSELGIFDARSSTLEPVATVKLPSRVPYGFHGAFLTEEQLAKQKSS